MSVLTFNFHNLAGVQIESDDPGATRFFEAEYYPSAAPLPQDIKTVNLRWRKKWSLWPSDPEYHFHIHKTLARWSYRIELQEGGIDIDAFGNRIAVPMIHHMMVHPSLRYLCAKSNALMLHGSAVVVKDRSLVFTGTGGVGKTTISSLLLLHGGKNWKLHADDYAFLVKGPMSFSYMTRSHLYRDLIRWAPSMKTLLTPRERLHLEFFGRLREMTKDGIKWALRIDASRLWPDYSIAPNANLAAIILLARGNPDHPTLEKIDATKEIVEELVEMNFYEARHFIELYRKAFGDPETEKWLETWKDQERHILQQLLDETSLYQLELPSGGYVSDRYGKELVELLLPIAEADGEEKPYA